MKVKKIVNKKPIDSTPKEHIEGTIKLEAVHKQWANALSREQRDGVSEGKYNSDTLYRQYQDLSEQYPRAALYIQLKSASRCKSRLGQIASRQLIELYRGKSVEDVKQAMYDQVQEKIIEANMT